MELTGIPFAGLPQNMNPWPDVYFVSSATNGNVGTARKKERVFGMGFCLIFVLFVCNYRQLVKRGQVFIIHVHSLFLLSNGSFKKKCQQNCSSVFCWSLLLFYSDKVHKQ